MVFYTGKTILYIANISLKPITSSKLNGKHELKLWTKWKIHFLTPPLGYLSVGKAAHWTIKDSDKSENG